MNVVKPLYRGYSHQIMFFVSLGACILLMLKSENQTELISTLIYSLGVLLMFGISALYHRVHWEPKPRSLMKRFDHSAIYIMIAGTFTPITLLVLPEPSGTRLLISIWSVAVLGIIQSIFFVNVPKMVSSILYLIAGYMIAPYFSELIPKLGMANLGLLIGGGVLYSIGALTYALKRPKLNPKVFGYHEVFHALVIAGAILHFSVIYSIV
ncbi:MAG: PAQR family membrane homeostasis protein TrhA [Bacteriovoracaceae bacterium]